MDPLVGAVVSHYRVLGQLGAGGMGVVYLAEDERLHRKAALKFIESSSAGDAAAQQRLLHEAQAASTLDHPNIATVYEVGDFQGQLFVAMAYYHGETLQSRIERGPLPIAAAVAIAQAIADGLAAAHAAGVAHRDLKPANIFLTSSEQVKILDFGLAKITLAPTDTTIDATKTGIVRGTWGYMAPEQALGRRVDHRADIWAFGVVLYEMLSGRQPYRGESAAAALLALASETAPPLDLLRPDVPPALRKVVERALVKEPERRTLTAADAAREIAAYREGVSAASTPPRWNVIRRPVIAIPLAVLLVAAIGAIALIGKRVVSDRWTRSALSDIARLADREDYLAAVALAAQVESVKGGDDPELAALWPRISRYATISSDPPGAAISIAAYGSEPGWRRLGTTPLTNIRLPLGVLRVKAEKPGFEAAEDVTFQGAGGAAAPSLTLIPAGTAPANMVRAAPAPGGFTVFVFGLSTPRIRLDGFWIDRHEVTNRQFKAFVDAGGYRRREFWRDPFVTGGRTLSFEEAMALFHDATGRPGPATWTVGSYAEGEDDFPVSGVSWYEASAYAAFAGKALPTIYHWYWVASQGLTGYVIPFGRYNAARPLPVNRTQALHRFGARDLAGNVKEWCLNEGAEGRRYILGGGFDESPYLFRDADARSPFDRGANFGFRTVKYDADDPSAAGASGIVLPPSRTFADKKPASDEVFAAYRRQYSYDRTDLAPKIEAVDQTNAQWRVEKVSYAAGYGADRVILYLFLPTQGKAPYQPIVYMPPAGAWDQRSSPSAANPPFGFLLRSGRAVAFPIYKGSFERSTAEFNGGDDLKTTSRWRDYVIMFSKDLGRTLDYLATRSDIDSGKTGFYGVSRGAALAPVMLAVEPRIKAAALWIPGLYREAVAPEVDAVHFAPRVTIPVLQLSGRYDYNFPDETSSAPFFQALGTRADRKRRVIYDTGHNLPPNDAIRETLNWFDFHLGPADAARGR